MRLASLTVKQIDIPFRTTFRHAQAARRTAQGVWVEARDVHGNVGFGEGCPRHYVTGESVQSARAFFARHARTVIRRIDGISALEAYTNEYRVDIDANPAAWCAIELALLDLAGKSSGRTVEALLGMPPLAGSFRYSAVLGDDSPTGFRATVDRYREAGLRDYKVKLSGRLAVDREKLDLLAAVPGLRIRVDANNFWQSPDAAANYLARLPATLFAVEEPIAAGDIAGLARIARALDTTMVLDESLLRASQLEQLPASGAWIANVRVSKAGGLLRSLALIETARERGVPVIVGAHVGETSVLTRAALTAARAAGTLLAAQEGAFGDRLLEHDVCAPPIMFGRGGLLQAPPPAPGLGVAVSRPPQRRANASVVSMV